MKRLRYKPWILAVLGWALSVSSPAIFGAAKSSAVIGAGQVTRIIADFDGDHLPDTVVARYDQSVMKVKIRLSSGYTQTLFSTRIDKEPGLKLVAYDVDDDSNIDLVLTSTFSQQPVAMWLNTSKGGFEKIKGWVAPILNHDGAPRFYRRVPQMPEQNVIGLRNPVPLIIVDNDLRYSLDEDRQTVKEGLAPAMIRPAASTYDRGPPLL